MDFYWPDGFLSGPILMDALSNTPFRALRDNFLCAVTRLGAHTAEIKDEVLVVLGVRPGAAARISFKIIVAFKRDLAGGFFWPEARSAKKRLMQLRWLGSVCKDQEKGPK